MSQASDQSSLATIVKRSKVLERPELAWVFQQEVFDCGNKMGRLVRSDLALAAKNALGVHDRIGLWGG